MGMLHKMMKVPAMSVGDFTDELDFLQRTGSSVQVKTVQSGCMKIVF